VRIDPAAARSRARACRWAFLALLALAAPALGARDELATAVLPWRVAGDVGFTVDAAAFPDSTGSAVEVYVRIPPATLAGLARDAEGRRTLTLRVRLKPGSGKSETYVQQIDFSPADTVAGFGKVVVRRIAARPGVHSLFVELKDELSRKRGLLYVGRKVALSTKVEGPVAVPKPADGREISNVEFVWSEQPSSAPGPFQHSGFTVIPNPERLYGKFAPRLQAFFVARAGDGDRRAWHWTARVTDPDGRGVWDQRGEGPAGMWLNGHFAMDVDGPAGGYDLDVEAWQEGDSTHLVRSSRFSVAWQPRTWFRNPREVEDDVHFLLNPDDADRFAVLPPGEQERYMEDFWARRDPTPDTEENEARETFRQRLAIANDRYSRAGVGPGMFSDMGRVYIQYGDPSEKYDQVIPTGDHTLSEILQEIARSEDRQLGEIHQKGPGGDIRPFEVWIYDGEIPLPPDVEPADDRNVRRRRLVFLFVDERGVGDFRLRYASE